MEKTEMTIDEMSDQIEAAAKEQAGAYTLKLSKPYSYGGKEYQELSFDWDKLTGNDFIDAETEIAAHGRILISPQFSSEFLAIMASKACTKPIGSDVIRGLPIGAFNMLRTSARNFLSKQA